MKKGKQVMVVYAYEPVNYGEISSGVWIYGVYTNLDEGFKVMQELENSKEYEHLIWNNNIITLK